ncbi:MAG: hypothetical protein VB948_13725, partial [Pseudomonadales bacterium]
DAKEFLDVTSYTHVVRWASEIRARPAVQRGKRVNRAWGPEEERVPERHSASDFDIQTENRPEEASEEAQQ